MDHDCKNWCVQEFTFETKGTSPDFSAIHLKCAICKKVVANRNESFNDDEKGRHMQPPPTKYLP